MLSGALWNPSWAIAILEYEFIGATVHSGTSHDAPVMNCLTHGNPSISNPRLRENYLNSRCGSSRFRNLCAISSKRHLVVLEHGECYIPGLRKGPPKCPE